MRTLPNSILDFSAPDADISRTIEEARQTLMLRGDPKWRLYSDADVVKMVAPSYIPPRYINQPKPNVPVREISLQELKDIIQTRERFPGYRSDVYISPEMKARIITKVQEKLADDSVSNFGNQPFTIIPSYKGADVPISDDLAMRAIFENKTVVPLPVTDFDPNIKRNPIMNKRYNDRHPVAFNSYPATTPYRGYEALVEPLNAFSAFSEVATTTGNSWLSGLLGVANAAATTYTNVAGVRATNKLAQTNALAGLQQSQLQAELLAAERARAGQSNTNLMPILLIGGGIIIAAVLLSKSSARA